MKLSTMIFFEDYWHMDWEAAATNKGRKGGKRLLKRTLSKARRRDSKRAVHEGLFDLDAS